MVVLKSDITNAREALYKAQVSTRLPLGAVIYFTGGILIDSGWIRIPGSGNPKLTRSIPSWNNGKSSEKPGKPSSFYLVADDVVGGFFAINTGKFDSTESGKIFYMSPDRLKWEPLGLTYAEFLLFCFSGDLIKFYGELRWNNWQKDVAILNGDEVFQFVPPLWSKNGKDISKNKKKPVPIEQQYQFNIMTRERLKLN